MLLQHSIQPSLARATVRSTRRVQLAPRGPVRTKATFTDAIVNSSVIVGQGIVYFTIFYTSMNWWYYRRMREDAEKQNENENKKK